MSESVKIAIFIHSLSGGGAERVTAKLASHFAQNGQYQVSVVTISEESIDQYELDPSVSRVCLQAGSRSKNHMDAILGNVTRILKLRSYLRESKSDVVISMMTESVVISAIACIGQRVVCIGSERNFPGRQKLGYFWSTLRKHTYRFADVIVVQTAEGERWLRKYTSVSRTAVIPNSINLPLPVLAPKLSLDLPSGSHIVLAVGRLVAQKQFDHLIDIFAAIERKFPEWVLVIVGEGNLRASLERQVELKSMNSRVYLPGRAGNMSDWYEKSSIVALTSGYEGFPNVLLEAMSHKKCVISYDCETGPSEIVQNHVTGRLIRADNQQEFSEVLASLMESPETRKTMGKAAYNSVISKFSESELMKLWGNLISRPNVP